MPKKTETKEVPKWQIEQEQRARKSAICELLAKKLADEPYLLERRLNDEQLDVLVRALVSLEDLHALSKRFEEQATANAKRAAEEAKYRAQSKARSDAWKANNPKPKKPKARAAAKPKPAPKAKATRARPYQGVVARGGSTPTPHRADGKGLAPVKLAGSVDASETALELESAALDFAEKHGDVTAGQLLAHVIGSSRGQATGALSRLVTRNRLVQTGKGRGTKYTLANGAGGAKAKPQLELGEVDAP